MVYCIVYLPFTRIQIFTPTGQHVQTVGREGTLNGQFKYPRGVLFDREGFILVGDSGNNRVQVMSDLVLPQYLCSNLLDKRVTTPRQHH